MKKIINKVAMLLLVVTMLVPSGNAFAGSKYFNVNRSEAGYEAFQESAENQIDSSDEVSFYSNGNYKFVIEKDDGFLGMNQDKVYDNAEDAMKDVSVSTDGDVIFFNLFTKDYTPKEYKQMLQNAIMHVYDANGDEIDSFSLLKYKDYIEFADTKSVMKVKLDSYIESNGVKTGANLNVNWNLWKEKPQKLVVENNNVDFYHNLDVSGKKAKDSMQLALDLSYNGTYTVRLTTEKHEYTQTIDFNKLELDDKKADDKENNSYTEKTDKVSTENVKISVSGIPSRKIEDGNSFTLIVTTNVKSNINMDGRVDSTYQKKHKFNITENGTYHITATSEADKSAKKTIKVNCFKAAPAVADKTYSRGNMWPGLPENRFDNEETLAQTGMYDSTILVVGILFVFTALLVGAQLIAEERKKKSGR